MKKTLLAIILLLGISSFTYAQYVSITRVEISTKNGTRPRKEVIVYLKLTSDGFTEFYNNDNKIKFKVTADWGISPLLTESSKKDTFYPTYFAGGSDGRANAQTMIFECVDYETALKLQERGVSSSDFYIESYVQ